MRAWQEAQRAEEDDADWCHDDGEQYDEIDGTEIDATAAGLDEQVHEEEHFDPDGGGGGAAAAAAGNSEDDEGGGGSDSKSDGDGGGGGGGGGGGDGGGGAAAAERRGAEWARTTTPTRRAALTTTAPTTAVTPTGSLHRGAGGRCGRGTCDMAETTGRIGQVVLLRAQHGYRRPPGVTIERLLRGEDEVAWAPGLGDAARPAAARLRQALLGWTRTEPVPASEAYARDVPTWRSQADAGEELAWRVAPSTQPPPPWEVEDGPTGDAQQAIAGFKERLDRRVTKVRGGCLTM